MIKVRFNKNAIYINDKTFELEYPIDTTVVVDEKVIVLFDPDSYTSKFGQFQNLIALDVEGHEIWRAELPTNESGDCYYMISEVKPLKASSWKSYECQIDTDTGKIVDMVFYK
jgi:hypothetical protein